MLGCTNSSDSAPRPSAPTFVLCATSGQPLRASQWLMSLEGISTLKSLSLLMTTDTRKVGTPATKLLTSCLTLPHLRVLELQGQRWVGHKAEMMFKKGLPHCRVKIRANPPQDQ